MTTRPESTADQGVSLPADIGLVDELLRSGLASRSEIRRCQAIQGRYARQDSPKSLVDVLIEKGLASEVAHDPSVV